MVAFCLVNVVLVKQIFLRIFNVQQMNMRNEMHWNRTIPAMRPIKAAKNKALHP